MLLRPLPDARALAWGRFFIVAAAVCWSTNGLLMKSPPMLTASPSDRVLMLACYRVLISGCSLAFLVDWRTVRWRPALLLMLLSFGSMNWAFSSAMVHTSAAVACFLQYTATAWAVLLGVVFLREPLQTRNLVPLVSAVVGIAWILHDQLWSSSWYGALLALMSGLSYAGVILSLRLLRDENPFFLISLGHFSSGLLILPVVLSQGLAPSGSQWVILAALGLFQMALPYVLFAKGLQSVPAQEGGLLSLLEAVLSPLWVLCFWGEDVSLATWIGGGWILAGLLLRYLVFRDER